jgi:hypothetical protein
MKFMLPQQARQQRDNHNFCSMGNLTASPTYRLLEKPRCLQCGTIIEDPKLFCFRCAFGGKAIYIPENADWTKVFGYDTPIFQAYDPRVIRIPIPPDLNFDRETVRTRALQCPPPIDMYSVITSLIYEHYHQMPPSPTLF